MRRADREEPLHAHDGWTTVAVGTYNDGHSVHLHGEDHLRQFALIYDNEAEAVAEFHRIHSVAVRPGPAPATDTERAAAAALTPLTPCRAPRRRHQARSRAGHYRWQAAQA
ncbi:hypothetical protein AB0F18_30295 [Streptomyces sp. NPDC029216]|uniref:hypothetical protein n=1 Tax=Streptomyces sp. NPDC029216 TaxID=3154701 RepID=UPI003405E42E